MQKFATSLKTTRRASRARHHVALLAIVTIFCSIVGLDPGANAGTSGAVALRSVSTRITQTAAPVEPQEPGALAVGPNGNLYIADGNRILERLPSGKFIVVAGSAEAGFAGDGGPATQARLDDVGGMAFAPKGALYFADKFSGRIREVAPDGTIATVAGGGRTSSSSPSHAIATGTRALGARFGSPADVAFGPDGRLYIADSGADEITRLERDGTLTAIAGGPDSPCCGVIGVGGPAIDASIDGPVGIAFNHSGDLFVAGINTKSLLVVTAGRMLEEISSGFYARGDGGIAETSGGQVVAMTDQNVVSVTPSGVHDIYSFSGRGFPFAGNAFLVNGIAVAPNGTIYVDTDVGNGFTRVSAIASLRAGQSPRMLWES